MVAHCLYRTVFVVGAVLARLEQFLLGWCYFLLGWCTSCLVGVTSCSGKRQSREETSAPPKSAPPKSAPPKVTTGCPSLLLMHRARLLKSLREHLRGT